MSETNTANEDRRKQRKVRSGVVVRSKNEKTVVVAVEAKISHGLYGKILTKTRKMVAHDENNECQIGDLVQIMETRPMSKMKRWRVTTILEKAK